MYWRVRRDRQLPGFVVPDADRLVHGTSCDDGFPQAHVHACHLPVVEGVGEEVERGSTGAL